MTRKRIELQRDDPRFYILGDHLQRLHINRVCLVPPGRPVPGHSCLGPNAVLEFDGYFSILEIFQFIGESNLEPESIRFDEIWFQTSKSEKLDKAVKTDRYHEADSSFPGILAELKNPDNKRFRMLDGRRRLWKQQAQGASEGMFYVIPVPKVFDFFRAVIPLDEFRNFLDETISKTSPGD